MTTGHDGAVNVALLNDFDVVIEGVRAMLAPYRDQVKVVGVATTIDQLAEIPADVVLFDTFGRPDLEERVRQIRRRCGAEVLVYSWAPLDAPAQGVAGYLSKRASPEELAAALVAARAGLPIGSLVGQAPPDGPVEPLDHEGDWPGRADGLTSRESEILSLIVLGLNNLEIAERLFLSLNTIKTHIRHGYQKMGVATRSQAVRWGIQHGFDRDAL